MRVILASNSPRRKELLSLIFPSFEVIPQNVEEICNKIRPSKKVVALALLKLGDLPQKEKDSLIISADTLVYMAGKVYGKPHDEVQAKCFLRELSGKKHSVYTGVAVYYKGKTYTIYDKSTVRFVKLDEKAIDDYVESGSPMDKAGAYGIQDKQVVDSYEGSYSNIVGLPVEKLEKLVNYILNQEIL